MVVVAKRKNAPKLKKTESSKKRSKKQQILESSEEESESEEEIEESDYEPEPVAKKTKTKPKSSPKTEEKIECLAVTFRVDDVLHPFHRLNNVTGNTRLDKIIGFPNKINKDDLKLGTEIQILKETDYHSPLPIKAIVSCEDIYKVSIKQLETIKKVEPVVSTRNNDEFNSSEKLLYRLNSNMEQMLQSSKNQNVLSRNISKINRNKDEDESVKSDESEDETSTKKKRTQLGNTQKEFTFELRSLIKKKFPTDLNKTMREYVKLDPEVVLDIKSRLKKYYIPDGIDFSTAWDRACDSIVKDKKKKQSTAGDQVSSGGAA